jgi:phage terminase large subunit-like protein
MEIKATDKNTFQSQYQQRPLAIKGNVLELENLGSYKKPEDNYEEIIVSVDSASSTSAVAANWGITVFGKHYLEGVLHLDLLYCHAAKYDYVQGMRKIKEIYEDKGGSVFMVENKSTGLAIIPSLKDEKDEKGERKYKVVEIQPVKSKEDRAMAAAPFLNKGRLRVPDVSDLPFTERWLSLFLYEVEGFGGAAARKCDLVDSMSQCVNHYYSGNTFNAKNFFKL